VGQLIEKRYGVHLSFWTVGRYLREWGFTPQKPIRQWLEEKYPVIRALARRDKAEIYWGDEMGLRSDHATGTSWGLKRQMPVIPGTGQRFGCSMISAITNRGKLYFTVLNKKFRARVFIDLLRRLERQVPRRIYFIVDRYPVHRAGAVKKSLGTKGRRVKLFYLPGYRPDLNQDVKSNAEGRRPPDAETMRKDISGYLRGRQRRPQIVMNYFKHESVLHAS
jgi:hypothetical protein